MPQMDKLNYLSQSTWVFNISTISYVCLILVFLVFFAIIKKLHFLLTGTTVNNFHLLNHNVAQVNTLKINSR